MGRFLRDRFASGDATAEARYRADLIARLQGQHLAGALASLEEVFVPPRLLAPQSGLSETELLDFGTSALHHLWPDLAAGVATIPPPSVTVSEMLAHGRRVLVSGEPGSGKSTLLAYCAIRWAGGAEDEGRQFQARLLPAHFHLADFESRLAELDRDNVWSPDPLDPLRDALEHSGFRIRGMAAALAGAAGEGRLCLLIDGWDELPDKGLGHTGRWLKECLQRFPATRVLIASPMRGYGPLIRLDFVVTSILPWRRGQAIEAGQRLAKAAGMSEPPELSQYWQPGQWPLTTTLRALMRARDRSAPLRPAAKQEVELLRDHVENAVRLSAAAGSPNDLESPIRKTIQNAAHLLVKDGAWGLSTDTVIGLGLADARGDLGPFAGRRGRQLLDGLAATGLFVQPRGSYRFLSPLIRDYLVAVHLIEQGALAEVAAQANEVRWAGVLRFCSSMAGLSTLLPLLASPERPSSRLYQSANWLVDSSGDDRLRESVLIGLGKICMDTSLPHAARQRAAAALALGGDPGVGALMSQILRQHETAMRQVAVAALARVSPPELVDAATRLMLDSHARLRAATVHALAWIDAPEAAAKLLEALYDTDREVSIAAAEGLALKGDEESFLTLRDAARSRAFGARQASRAGLRMVDEPWAKQAAAKSATTDGLRAATGPLSIADDGSVEKSERWRRSRAGDQSWLVTWAVAQARVVPVGQAAVPILLEALQDREASVRMRAAATLGQLALVDGIEALREAVKDESPEVREASYIALVKIGRAWDSDL